MVKTKDLSESKEAIYRSDYKIRFKELESVNNPKSIHGIYPYRGKMSPFDAEQIITQLPKNKKILDPFCGSGTILYEAQKHGMETYGVELNPLAYTISNAKVNTNVDKEYVINKSEELINKAQSDLENGNIKEMPVSPLSHFHEDTAKEIMSIKNHFNEMNDYLKSAYYGAIALTARGCNRYKWTSSTVGKDINPKRYICFYDKFRNKCKKHFMMNQSSKNAFIYNKNSLNLSDFIEENSIDFVFTSPPYFNSLDYTAYYAKIIYEIHEVDRKDIKEDLIQNLSDYEEQMKKVMVEIERVTKDNALIFFVVGDKKIRSKKINGGEFFSKLHKRKPSYIVERGYTGSSSQVFDELNNTKRKEQIVVWDKKKGL